MAIEHRVERLEEVAVASQRDDQVGPIERRPFVSAGELSRGRLRGRRGGGGERETAIASHGSTPRHAHVPPDRRGANAVADLEMVPQRLEAHRPVEQRIERGAAAGAEHAPEIEGVVMTEA